jgi:murein L,D-transpeptidase YcbB/YkuD
MRLNARRLTGVSAIAVAALATFGVGDAAAGNLFDTLFGGPRERVVRPESVQPAEPPPVPKVAAPSYYTYKADALVKVDFRKLIAAAATREEGGVDPVTHSVTVASAEAASSPNVVRIGEAPAAPSADGAPQAAPTAASPDVFAAAVEGLDGYELFAEKDIADAVVKHYQADPKFIWIADMAPNEQARTAMSVLADAPSQGLDARDYEIVAPDLAGLDDHARLAALAQFEMKLSARVLRYVRDAWRGRVDPNRLSGYHDFAPKPLDYAQVMKRLAAGGPESDYRAYLESWHPKNAQYAALRQELATLRASQENEIVVDPDIVLHPGDTSPELPKLLTLMERQGDGAFLSKFGSTLIAATGSQVYGPDLVPLVKAAQEAKGLKPDGVIGPRTVAALAGSSKADRLAKVLVAMEQIRWLPSTLGARHVLINVPEFRAAYVEGGQDKLAMKVVVGKTATQTFFFEDEIEYVEFHPYWGIPRSILVNKYLPKLYADPSYLDRIGYEITDSRGRQIPSSAIDWTSYGSKIPFDVRQPPGPRNSLGEMKIMFPNAHAIYMHDTPEKELFGRDSRAYSNGCVRLQDPRGMAAAVLGWSREQVAAQLKQSGNAQQVQLSQKVPVYVVYFTAWPHADGQVAYSADVYGRDAYVRKALDKIEQVRLPGV